MKEENGKKYLEVGDKIAGYRHSQLEVVLTIDRITKTRAFSTNKNGYERAFDRELKSRINDSKTIMVNPYPREWSYGSGSYKFVTQELEIEINREIQNGILNNKLEILLQNKEQLTVEQKQAILKIVDKE